MALAAGVKQKYNAMAQFDAEAKDRADAENLSLAQGGSSTADREGGHGCQGFRDMQADIAHLQA